MNRCVNSTPRMAGRFGFGMALFTVGVLLISASVRAQQAPPQSKIIDSLISKSWNENKLTPAKMATDNEFIRRVFLDVIGRTPTSEEVRDFVERDKGSNKRARLVHRLLFADAHKLKDAAGKDLKGDDGKPIVFEYTREYAEHWADIWTVWTMTRAGTHEDYHTQMNFWLTKQFADNKSYDEIVRHLLTASGKGNDDGAANFVMAHLGEPSPGDKRMTDGPFDSIPITSRVTRLFLGIQTQCTQCHDHPFNPEWGQENFWGVNAFFRQTTRDRTPAPPAAMNKKKAIEPLPVTLSDDPKLNSGQRIYYERRSGVLMSIKPTFLPNLADLEKEKAERAKKPLPSETTKSRREVLADYVISHDNFGKAYVNRIWAHFFGRGLNEQPVPDDFGGHNKVIHPELLEQLGQEFVKYQYNPKSVIEWICNSEPYNLSYIAPNKEMAKPDYDVFFARMPLKAMSPEVLFTSLETAVKADQAVDKEARKTARENWMRKLVNNFGDDEGNEMTFNGTIVQALLMMNGKELNDEIKRGDGTVAKVLAKAAKLPPTTRDQFLIDEIFLTTLGRKPSTTVMVSVDAINAKTKKKSTTVMSEADFVRQQVLAAKVAGTGIKGKGPYEAFFEDLFWTLLNTNEFMLNH